ncbi:MAG TPA: hypothetical protein VF453_08110 [Burkholderiaceae bacterium]
MLEAPSASDVATPPAPEAQPNEQQAERLTREIVARFACDPVAFATSYQVEPSAFVRDYLQSLNKRLSGFATAPREAAEPSRRLATLGFDQLADVPGGLPVDADLWGPENAPRMGAAAVVSVVASVATVVTSVVQAYTALTSLIKHKPL